MSKKAEQAQVATVELLSAEEITKLIDERYAVAGGSKYAVFRDLFTRGFKVKEVHKMLEGQKGFEKLIYQHVRNEHQRFIKSQG